ncbi:hypothetical protein P7K49_035802 [Saguinus oedipus]|uniref:Vesicle transport protein n=1 Tax=Saguinus oedipus TaxID=9490 RepID=A0ABQ9TQC6_SAGOE|nr:hypothetical protein P7K49_035802 [Saguinus oedipus]
MSERSQEHCGSRPVHGVARGSQSCGLQGPDAVWRRRLLAVGVVVTFLVLLIFSYNVVFLFVGTASLGLFLSSTFPSMLAYTEDSLQYKEDNSRERKNVRIKCI